MSHAAAGGVPVVLVVEDEFFVRTDIADQLRTAGFIVLEAETGERALEFAKSGHGVDILFTDIRLGGELDGWDVGEAFRSARPHVAVIYASGGTIVPPREVPDSRFFAKPYRGWEVVDACRELSGGGHPAKAVRG